MKKLWFLILSLTTLYPMLGFAFEHKDSSLFICNFVKAYPYLHFKKTYSYQADINNDHSADFILNYGAMTIISYWWQWQDSAYDEDDRINYCVYDPDGNSLGSFSLKALSHAFGWLGTSLVDMNVKGISVYDYSGEACDEYEQNPPKEMIGKYKVTSLNRLEDVVNNSWNNTESGKHMGLLQFVDTENINFPVNLSDAQTNSINFTTISIDSKSQTISFILKQPFKDTNIITNTGAQLLLSGITSDIPDDGFTEIGATYTLKLDRTNIGSSLYFTQLAGNFSDKRPNFRIDSIAGSIQTITFVCIDDRNLAVDTYIDMMTINGTESYLSDILVRNSNVPADGVFHAGITYQVQLDLSKNMSIQSGDFVSKFVGPSWTMYPPFEGDCPFTDEQSNFKIISIENRIETIEFKCLNNMDINNDYIDMTTNKGQETYFRDILVRDSSVPVDGILRTGTTYTIKLDLSKNTQIQQGEYVNEFVDQTLAKKP